MGQYWPNVGRRWFGLSQATTEGRRRTGT
jgi:hypothetical protein